MCGKSEGINFMIVPQILVNNAILSLQLGWGMVSSVRIYSKLRHLCTKVMKRRLYDCQDRDRVSVNLGLNVNSSALNYRCMVDGGGTMAPICVF